MSQINLIKRYYKDRDFPEIKTSNSDIVAVIERPKELARVINEHNALIDRLIDQDFEIARLLKFKEAFEKHYDIYGYEKPHYLLEQYEAIFGSKPASRYFDDND